MRAFQGQCAAHATGAGASICVAIFDFGYGFGGYRCRSATRAGNSAARRSDEVMLRAGNHANILVTDHDGLIKLAVYL